MCLCSLDDCEGKEPIEEHLEQDEKQARNTKSILMRILSFFSSNEYIYYMDPLQTE